MKNIDFKFSEEELNAIEDLAACNYSPKQIALYLEVNKEAFLSLWKIQTSDVRQRFERGKLVSEFTINNKQKLLAEAGNITATQIFLNQRREVEVATIRNNILFGENAD